MSDDLIRGRVVGLFVGQFAAILKDLGNDVDTETWRLALRAAREEFGASPEALEMLDRWSQSVPGYRGLSVVTHWWFSFDDAGPGAVAELLYIAKSMQGRPSAARVAKARQAWKALHA